MLQTKEYERFTSEFKRKFNYNKDNIVCLCVGSNNIIGDCFGPMVGSNLSKMKFKNKVTIIGNMHKPITANNFAEKIKKVNKKQYIIAIDSALSKYNVEGIFISKSKMKLGGGIDQEFAEIGDISIKCCVAQKMRCKFDSLTILNKVKKNDIYELSKMVSKGIYDVIESK